MLAIPVGYVRICFLFWLFVFTVLFNILLFVFFLLYALCAWCVVRPVEYWGGAHWAMSPFDVTRKFSLLFKQREIWSVDSQYNISLKLLPADVSL